MILAIAWTVWVAALQTGAQDTGRHVGAQIPATQDPARQRTLQRDPRKLIEAPVERWRDFDATKIQPSEIPAGIFAMQSAVREGDLVRAIGELYTVLDALPDYPPALHELGVLYFKLQRYSDGAVALERFLRVMPSKVGETRVLGHCYYSLGEYEKARAHYERVLAAAPDEIEAARGLALTMRRLGDETRALELLDRVLESRPDHVDAWIWKAQILYEQGHSETALVAAQKARDLDPFLARAWFLLGQILVDLARPDEARVARARYEELSSLTQQAQSLESRLEFDPHQAGLWMDLARVRVRAGDAVRARAALKKLLAERPGDVRVHIFALDSLVELGDADGARAAAHALETQCADEADAWRRLEVYYASVKNTTKQLQAGERYRRLKAD